MAKNDGFTNFLLYISVFNQAYGEKERKIEKKYGHMERKREIYICDYQIMDEAGSLHYKLFGQNCHCIKR